MSGRSEPVGPTARITAAWRAHEHERAVEPGAPSKLFQDPLASLLAGPAAMQKLSKLAAAPPPLLKFIRTMHVRTRFFDDAITSVSSQVVILGAGLDTRAYRVEGFTESATYYEVDRAEMNAYKNGLLEGKEAKCVRVPVDADLSGTDWVEKLFAAGFNKDVPTTWILEGMIYYLSPEEADFLMISIWSLSAESSVFSADLMNSAVINGDDPASARWKFGVDYPLEFVARYGWSQCTAQLPGEIARERGYVGYEEVDDSSEPDAKVKYWLAAGKKKT